MLRANFTVRARRRQLSEASQKFLSSPSFAKIRTSATTATNQQTETEQAGDNDASFLPSSASSSVPQQQEDSNNLFQDFLARFVPFPPYLLRFAVFTDKLSFVVASSSKREEKGEEEEEQERWSYAKQAAFELEHFRRRSKNESLRLVDPLLGRGMLQALLRKMEGEKNDDEEKMKQVFREACCLFPRHRQVLSSSTSPATTSSEMKKVIRELLRDEKKISKTENNEKDQQEEQQSAKVVEEKKEHEQEEVKEDNDDESSLLLLEDFRIAADQFFHPRRKNVEKDENPVILIITRKLLQKGAAICTEVPADELANIFAAYAIFASQLHLQEQKQQQQQQEKQKQKQIQEGNSNSSSSSFTSLLLPFEFVSEVKSVAYVVSARLEAGLMTSTSSIEKCALSAVFLQMNENLEFWQRIFRQTMIKLEDVDFVVKKGKQEEEEQEGAKKEEEEEEENHFAKTKQELRKDRDQEEEQEFEIRNQKKEESKEQQLLELERRSLLGILFAFQKRTNQIEQRVEVLAKTGKEASFSLNRALQQSQAIFETCESKLKDVFL